MKKIQGLSRPSPYHTPQQIPRLIFETLGGSNTLLHDHENCSFPRHYTATHAHFRPYKKTPSRTENVLPAFI